MRYLKRILGAPFIFGLLVVVHGFFVIKRTFQFIRYSGEASIYKKDDLKTIQDIYKEIKEKRV